MDKPLAVVAGTIAWPDPELSVCGLLMVGKTLREIQLLINQLYLMVNQ